MKSKIQTTEKEKLPAKNKNPAKLLFSYAGEIKTVPDIRDEGIYHQKTYIAGNTEGGYST